ncbi:MAG: hypothetical protein ACRDP1_14225 [Nocardioidaceae bacterium]
MTWMDDHGGPGGGFDDELRSSLDRRAEQLPYVPDLSRAAIGQARAIRRRRRVVGSFAAAALVAIAIPAGIEAGSHLSGGAHRIGPATHSTNTPPTHVDGSVKVDFAVLPAGAPPSIPYTVGHTLHDGSAAVNLFGSQAITGVAVVQDKILTIQQYGPVPRLVELDLGGHYLGKPDAAVSSLAGSADRRYAAYYVYSADKFGNPQPGGDLVRYDSSDHSYRQVALTGVATVRVFAIVDGAVYFRTADQVDHRSTLMRWTPGSAPVAVAPGLTPTAVSDDGSLVATVTKLTGSGSCSEVRDLAAGTTLWHTCDHQILGFSTDGRYVWTGPDYADGYAATSTAVLDARTGEPVLNVEGAPGSRQTSFMTAQFETDGRLLMQVEHSGRTALVRCDPAGGRCETAAGPTQGTVNDGDAPYLLSSGR